MDGSAIIIHLVSLDYSSLSEDPNQQPYISGSKVLVCSKQTT